MPKVMTNPTILVMFWETPIVETSISQDEVELPVLSVININ